VSIRKSDVYTS